MFFFFSSTSFFHRCLCWSVCVLPGWAAQYWFALNNKKKNWRVIIVIIPGSSINLLLQKDEETLDTFNPLSLRLQETKLGILKTTHGSIHFKFCWTICFMRIFHVKLSLSNPVADIIQRDKLITSVKSCGNGLIDMFGQSMFLSRQTVWLWKEVKRRCFSGLCLQAFH